MEHNANGKAKLATSTAESALSDEEFPLPPSLRDLGPIIEQFAGLVNAACGSVKKSQAILNGDVNTGKSDSHQQPTPLINSR